MNCSPCPHHEILWVDRAPLPHDFIEFLHQASLPVRVMLDEDEALQRLRAPGVAVIVAEQHLLRRMATVLQHAAPAHLVRLLITNPMEPHADFAAINEVPVFRILEKPLKAHAARRYLDEALALHNSECLASQRPGDGDTGLRDALAFLAHEVNGPLSVIQGYARAQALCLGAFSTMPPPAGPLKMALEATERSARHCQTLMTWAAETAKCASHGHEPLTPLASEVLERMLQSYPFAGEEKRWVFVDVERDARLPAKTELLRLTLVTLMRQALDALQGVAQPCLKISLCVREDTHCIRFSHNGRRPPEKFHEALAAGRFQAWGGPGTAFVFCQRAMRSIQGDVRIVLGAGKETSVLLCFGPVDEKLADPRKRDLALRLSP